MTRIINEKFVKNKYLKIFILIFILSILNFIQSKLWKSWIKKFKKNGVDSLKKTFNEEIDSKKLDEKCFNNYECYKKFIEKLRQSKSYKKKIHINKKLMFKSFQKYAIKNYIASFIIFFVISKFFDIKSSMISIMIYLAGIIMTNIYILISKKVKLIKVNVLLIILSILIDLFII
jgi:hypothetical protein